MIVHAWVNDEDSKHAYDSGSDAYRVFRRMLESGNPRDNWTVLLAQAKAEGKRLRSAADKAAAS